MTIEKIRFIFPDASILVVGEFEKYFNMYADKFAINTLVQENLFLATIREEVGSSLKPRRENLNYSCDALKKVFGYYKQKPKEAVEDGRCNGHKANQKKIANKAYASRYGNGDINSDDGWRYRGSFFIQLTFKDNWDSISQVISLAISEPVTVQDMLEASESIEMSILASFAFWFKNGIHKLKDIDKVTEKVNKHTKSYDKRKEHYLRLASL